MEPKTGFLIWWILTTIQVMTCRPTDEIHKVIARINYTKDKMEIISGEFDLVNKITNRWPEPISELDLKNLNTEEKLQRAQCGLHYMEKAVELIRADQRELRGHVKYIPDNIKLEFDRTRYCVNRTIGDCTNMTEPNFPDSGTYQKIQWSATVLNVSVEFLVELVNVVKEHELRPTPKKSVKSKNHQINTARHTQKN